MSKQGTPLSGMRLERIDPSRGDFLVMVDYYSEGLSVVFQTDDPGEAVAEYGRREDAAVVQLVRINFREPVETKP